MRIFLFFAFYLALGSLPAQDERDCLQPAFVRKYHIRVVEVYAHPDSPKNDSILIEIDSFNTQGYRVLQQMCSEQGKGAKYVYHYLGDTLFSEMRAFKYSKPWYSYKAQWSEDHRSIKYRGYYNNGRKSKWKAERTINACGSTLEYRETWGMFRTLKHSKRTYYPNDRLQMKSIIKPSLYREKQYFDKQGNQTPSAESRSFTQTTLIPGNSDNPGGIRKQTTTFSSTGSITAVWGAMPVKSHDILETEGLFLPNGLPVWVKYTLNKKYLGKRSLHFKMNASTQ
ncbi:MAG: hypothetical protein KGS48_07645 [Bacteroidetes bacterium]|nr:hypothetical protein [Bacteroidota bacterium]